MAYIRRHWRWIFEIYGQLPDKHGAGNLHNTLWIQVCAKRLKSSNLHPPLGWEITLHIYVNKPHKHVL